ncbi:MULTISPECIES: hypothetical protein [Chryseobacterium]|uniref:hypothetical protein n=1 Tax=Chryseobacterium TaxID=59732 RepID=UPI0016296F28|nr:MULTISPECIES: hypothetical protein [Chryseobacterium]MBF6643896.1 hypothetical protein [Chryseobacterium indologenes]MBU3047145.1 hypothetical protein [Chryseobacterium indologenes]QQQ72377.1 hypothetical protein JHW31_06535 [Chryseobacterium indologenes]
MFEDLLLPAGWGSIPDLIQASCAIIAVPLTLITLIKLVKRDRAREKEISNLSGIADMLTKLVAHQHQMDKNANRPQINVEAQIQDRNKVRFDFTNQNTRATITSFELQYDKEDSMMQSTINSINGIQSFFAELSFTQKLHLRNFLITYNTEEGYQYKQEISWYEGKKMGVSTVFDSNKLN